MLIACTPTAMEVPVDKPEGESVPSVEAAKESVASASDGREGEENTNNNDDDPASNSFAHHLELPLNLPDPSKRRRSQVVGQDQSGCYLIYDQNQAKWVAVWSSSYVAEAVAIVTPHVKVPAFKYTKREKVVLEGEKNAHKDIKHDYLAGLCGFFKIVRDFKGDLTLLPSADDLELKEMVLIGLHAKEIIRFDKFDFTYPFLDLDCVALVPKKSVAFNSKQMEQAIFMGKASREGFALSLKNKP